MEKRIKKAEGFQTVHYTVGSKQIPKEFDGYRIAHLSDLHGQAYGRDNKTLVSKICGLKPDMIAMTGDMADQGKDSIQ